MDAHWLRLHHGTYTDPKWRIVVTRCHAKSHQVTTAEVLAVWMCMLELASQASTRGELEGWCAEDIAAALGLAEERVAAIYEAMQGKTLDGNRLISWEKRQPKREREDATAAERKRLQREREAAERAAAEAAEAARIGVTGRDIGKSHHVTPRGEERREEEKHSNTSRSVDQPSHSQRECASEGDRYDGHDPDQVPADGREFELLDEHEQDLVRGVMCPATVKAGVNLKLLAQFVDHARQKKGFTLSAGWIYQLRIQIHQLHADGHDVNASLTQTIRSGNCVQLLIPTARGTGPPARTNGVTQDFEHVDYAGE